MNIIFFNQKLSDYLYSLEKPSVSKFAKLVKLLEMFGEKLGMPYAKQINTNLYELRIRGRQEVRVFYCFHRGEVMFLHAFIKKSNKTPPREIQTALNRISLLT